MAASRCFIRAADPVLIVDVEAICGAAALSVDLRASCYSSGIFCICGSGDVSLACLAGVLIEGGLYSDGLPTDMRFLPPVGAILDLLSRPLACMNWS